tara:strand:+ start:8 stop:268 length:261 start_codon:yes stop_codon:yes gene_type:complete
MEEKECPFCGEIIKAKAVVCRFCQIDLASGQSLAQAQPPQSPETVNARSGIEDGVNLGCGMFIVLPLLILGAVILLFWILAFFSAF